MSTSAPVHKTPLVAFTKSDGINPRAYWLRLPKGGYKQVCGSFLSLELKRQGIKNITELVREARGNPVALRYMAGQKPGVYETEKESYINPETVPLVKLLSRPNPSEEFARTFKRLRSWMNNSRECNGQIKDARNFLLEMYQKDRRVQLVTTGRNRNPWRLLGKNSRSTKFPCDDHCQLFKGDMGYIWTSQPYHVEPERLLGFAKQHGLTVTVSPKWGWYYPGKAPLIEWTRSRP